jgi:glycosyltransferase involved in cell wall biosynthesis
MLKNDEIDISVLMTVYNGGRFLRKSIESILCQTYSGFEFLIVDDKSTDESVEIIKSYTDRRIRLISNAQNIGQTKSLNIGLRQAKGRYVARMDADDMAFPQWLERLYRFANFNPEYCVVSPQALVIDESYRIKQITKSPLTFNEILMESLIGSPINHVGALMRIEEVINAGGYDERFKFVADYALWSSLISKGYRLINMGEVLTVIRIHSTSASQLVHGKNNMLEAIEIMNENIKQLTDCKISFKDIESIWQFVHNMRRLQNADYASIDALSDNIYNSLKSSLGISSQEQDKFRKQKKQEICIRKVFISIKMGKHRQARHILKEYIRIESWFSLVGFLYILSTLRILRYNFDQYYLSMISSMIKTKYKHKLKCIMRLQP